MLRRLGMQYVGCVVRLGVKRKNWEEDVRGKVSN